METTRRNFGIALLASLVSGVRKGAQAPQPSK